MVTVARVSGVHWRTRELGSSGGEPESQEHDWHACLRLGGAASGGRRASQAGGDWDGD